MAQPVGVLRTKDSSSKDVTPETLENLKLRTFNTLILSFVSSAVGEEISVI